MLLLSLNEAQSLALKQNPEVLQAQLEISKSSANLKAVITKRYPSLLNIAFTGRQITSPYQQNLAVLPGIFEPVTQHYRIGMEVQEANLAVGIAQQRLRLAKQRNVADVKTLYLNMLALKSSISSLESNLEFLKELARYVQAQAKRGSVLEVDALVVQARVARADFEVDKARDDITTMGENLNRLLGRSALAQIELIDQSIAPLPETREDDQIAEALSKRPELSEVKFNIHRSDLERKVILSRYIPDVSVGATAIVSHGLDVTLPRNYAAVGFLSIWEPWDWGRKIQNGKEQDSKTRQEQVKLRDMSVAVSIDVDKARRDVRLANKEAIAGSMGEESTKEQLRIVHRRFLAGAALLKEVMEAQSTYTKAIAENVKAKIDMAAARVELDEALGRDF